MLSRSASMPPLSATLQQRVDALLAGAGLPPMKHVMPPAESDQSSVPQLDAPKTLAAFVVPPKSLENSLGLPPPAKPISTMFLPHKGPVAKPHRGPELVSWEQPSIRDLLASSVEERKSSAALSATSLRQAGVHQLRSSRSGVAGFGLGDSSSGVAIDCSGSRPALVRVSSRPSTGGSGGVARLGFGRTPTELAPSHSTSQLGAGLGPHCNGRSPRLLPRDLGRAEISARMPSLAYSHYRPLDLYRGGGAHAAGRSGTGGVGGGARFDEIAISRGAVSSADLYRTGAATATAAALRGGWWSHPAPLTDSSAPGTAAPGSAGAVPMAIPMAGPKLRPTTAPEATSSLYSETVPGGRGRRGERPSTREGAERRGERSDLATTSSRRMPSADRRSTNEIRESIAAQMTGLMVGDLFEKVTIREARTHEQPTRSSPPLFFDGADGADGGGSGADDGELPSPPPPPTSPCKGSSSTGTGGDEPLAVNSTDVPAASTVDKAASRAFARLGAIGASPEPGVPGEPASTAARGEAVEGGEAVALGEVVALKTAAEASPPPPTEPVGPADVASMLSFAFVDGGSAAADLPADLPAPALVPGAALMGAGSLPGVVSGYSWVDSAEKNAALSELAQRREERLAAQAKAEAERLAVEKKAREKMEAEAAAKAKMEAEAARRAAIDTTLAHEARAAVQKLAPTRAMHRRRAHSPPRQPKMGTSSGAVLGALPGAPGASPAKLRLKGLLKKAMAKAGKGNAFGKGNMMINGRVMPVNFATIAMTHVRSKVIAAALRREPCFAALSAVQLSMLSAGGEERRVQRYSVIYREGSEARSFYVLLAGRLEHSNQVRQRSASTGVPAGQMSAPVPHSNAGVCFGVEGLTGGLRRLTTVTAIEDSTVLHFSTHGMLLDEGGAAALAANVFGRVVAEVLRSYPLFAQAAQSGAQLDALAALFRLEEFPMDVPIFTEGAPADQLCVPLD